MKTDIDYHPQEEEEENSRRCLAEIVPYQLLQGVFIFITAAVLSFTFFFLFPNLCPAKDRVMIFGNSPLRYFASCKQ